MKVDTINEVLLKISVVRAGASGGVCGGFSRNQLRR